MKKISLLSLVTISVTLVLVGCSKVQRDYDPLVPKGTFATITWNEEAIVNSSMTRFFIDEHKRYNDALIKVLKEDEKNKKFLDSFSKSDVYEKCLEQLDESDCKWALVTIAKPDFSKIKLGEQNEIAVPSSVTVGYYKNDKSLKEICEQARRHFEKQFCSYTNNAACNEKLDKFFKENLQIIDSKVAGCDVKVLKILNEEFNKAIKDYEPCFGVFDKRLVIVASSQGAFADTVALYKGELESMAADSQQVKDIALSGDIVASANIYNFDEIVKELTSKQPIADEQLAKYVAALQSIGFGLSLNDEKGNATYSLGARFSNEEIAQELATLANVSMGMLNSIVAVAIMQKPSLSFLPEFTAGIKPAAQGNAIAIELTLSRAMLEKLDYEKIIRENKEALCKLPCRKKCKDTDCEEE